MNEEPEQREVAGVPYWALARVYASEEEAKQVLAQLQRVGRKHKGRLDLGVYRARPVDSDKTNVILIVSLKERGIRWAARAIGGKPYHGISEREWDAMLFRRARVVQGIREEGRLRGGGSLLIRRGRRGAYLRPDGTLDEQIGSDD